MKSLKVKHRLLLGFGAVVSLLAIAAGFAAHLVTEVQDELKAISERRLPNTVVAGKFVASLLQTARHTRNMLIVDDPAKIATEIAGAREHIRKCAEYLTFLDKNVKAPEVRAQLEATKIARLAYLPLETNYLTLVESNMMKEAKAYLLEIMRPAQFAYLTELEKFIDVQARITADGATAANAKAAEAIRELVAAIIGATLVAALIAWLVTRAILIPLNRAIEVSREVAKGNLRNDIVVDRDDELGTLLGSLGQMQGSLADLVRRIQGDARELASASEELASTAEQVSVASNNQSEAAAAMAASVEEMTVSVSHITESAELAAGKTEHSNRLSQTGRTVVENAGTEMHSIAEGIRGSAETVAVLQAQSQEISSIADVIKTIAEQTNLLALNAAIEAARAGESGRGFAVVADAVRELAERTARSTAEIGSTIEKIHGSTRHVHDSMGRSVEQAGHGLKLSEEAGRTITELSDSAGEVLAAISEITSALKEQKQASSDIARHVEGIAQMAQENSSAVAQAKDSAGSLQRLAGSLRESVMRFAV